MTSAVEHKKSGQAEAGPPKKEIILFNMGRTEEEREEINRVNRDVFEGQAELTVFYLRPPEPKKKKP